MVDLIATLDNTTVGSVEKWLEQENFSPRSRPPTRPTGLSSHTATGPNTNTNEPTGDSSSPSLEAANHFCLDRKKAAAVQPQVRHISFSKNDITILPSTGIGARKYSRCLRYVARSHACNISVISLSTLCGVFKSGFQLSLDRDRVDNLSNVSRQLLVLLRHRNVH